MESRFAWRESGGVAFAVFAVLLATSRRYGYHRDELYFLVAGRHPAWGYDDQPAFTPVLAALMDRVAPGDLTVLRLPSAVCAAATVLLVAAIAYEMGADRIAQILSGMVAATATFVVYSGHLLSTATFDLFFATVLVWLLARWHRTARDRLLLWAGAVAGLALNNKLLIVFPLVAFTLSLPRLWSRPLFWAGAAIALAAWTPYLLWQSGHGWPQIEMAGAVTDGEPAGGRLLLLPMQPLLFGPLTAPIWLAGLWRLLRNPDARPWRGFGVAYLVLLAMFLVSGGQFYYPSAGYPALIAAGSIATVQWVRRGGRLRTSLAVGAVALTALSTAAMSLPVYPIGWYGRSPQVAANPDAAETVGWPELVTGVAGVHEALPEPGAAIFTANYGQAGAVDRFGPEYGLPTPYSGHNAYWRWGPPPDAATTAVVVGSSAAAAVRPWCGSLTLAATHDNRLDVDNDEQGTPIWICRGLTRTWSQLWPELRHLG